MLSEKNKLSSLSLVLAALIIITIAYCKVYSFSFVYDDHETILRNEYVKSLGNIKHFFLTKEATSPITHLKYEIFRPLKSLSIAIDYGFFGTSAGHFHITNLLMHLFVVCGLFFLILYNTSSYSSSFAVALFFGLHPALIHNVAYISARSDILAMIFLIPVLFMVFHKGELSAKLIFAVYLSFLLSLMAKETALAIAVFIVLFNRKLTLPLKVVLIISSIALLWFIYRYYVLRHLSQGGYPAGNFFLTQITMVKSWFYYLSGFFWPLKTEVIPFIGIEQRLSLRVIIFFILLIIFCISAKRKTEKIEQYWIIAGLCFFLPVANIIPLKAFFSWRFVYIPFFCFSVALGYIFHRNGRVLKFILIILIIINGYRTWLLSGQYRNDLTLWQPVMDKYPHLSKSYRVISRYYLQKGMPGKSIEFIKRGLRNVRDAEWLKWEEARIHIFRKDYSQAYLSLSSIPQEKRMYMDSEFFKDWLYVLYKEKRYSEIIDEYRQTKNFRMDNSDSLLIIANALSLENFRNEALIIYRRLLKDPEISAEMRNNLEEITTEADEKNESF